MEPRRLPRKVYAPSQYTRDLCGELQDSRGVRGVLTPRDYSARRIALYTWSQCVETSSNARAVVRAAASSPSMIFSTSVSRASRARSLFPTLSSSCARTSLSVLLGDIASSRSYLASGGPQAAPSGKVPVCGSVMRSFVPSGLDSSPARRPQREVFGCRSARSGALDTKEAMQWPPVCATNDGCP
jgi:hypothetical protein